MKRLIQSSITLGHGLLLFIGDSAVGIFSLWAGFYWWQASPYRMLDRIPAFEFSHVLLYVLLIDAVLIWGGTYRIHSSISHVLWFKEIIKYATLGFGVAIGVGFFTKLLLVSRLQVFLTFLVFLPMIILERLLIDRLWSVFVARKLLLKKVVIFGAGDTGKRLARAIERHPKLGYRLLAFFDDYKDESNVVMANPVPVLGGKAEFVAYLAEHPGEIDEVLIAMPAASTETNMQVMGLCREYGVPFKFVPTLNDLMLHRIQQEQLDGIPLFSTREIGIPLTHRITKRLFDIVFSGLALMVFSPLMALIAWWIKRDSPGPAIFKQTRIGFKGKPFTMYKFRTMFVNVPPYDWHPKGKDDPRITRVGRFLRKTSLDELPQFWNVLKGDMSIVGPRPEMPFIVAQYNEYQKERLNAKPGITGLWQISGDRSLAIHENIDHDLYYISHQSLLLDLVIILQTIWFALIRGVGAK